MNIDIPKAGQVYKHFKGNYYTVLCLAKHTETGEDLVVYRSTAYPEKFWVRPLSMWLKPAPVNGKEVVRFKRVRS
jgi:hypothetical protein